MVGRQFLAAVAFVLERRRVKENIVHSNIVVLNQRDLKTEDSR
jgi:hypothetical protein